MFLLRLCFIQMSLTVLVRLVLGDGNLLSTDRNATASTVIDIQVNNGTIKNIIEDSSTRSVVKNTVNSTTDQLVNVSKRAEVLPSNITTTVSQNNSTVSSTNVTDLPSLINNGTVILDKVNQVITNISQNEDKIKEYYDKAVKVGTFVKDVSSTVQETSKGLQKSFDNLHFNNQSVIVKNIDFIARSANKSLTELGDESVDVLRSLNESRPDNGTGWKNQITILKAGLDTLKNTSVWIDPNFNPTRWMVRTNVPWKHVEPAKTKNDTQVLQVCKFDLKSATCSAEYTSWNAKLWFTFVEDNKGINISTYERGNHPRVTFLNKINGTDCARFKNGTFHQICVKVYGYEMDSGPTRVCLQIGAAIFNHGTASTDFGCFRFGKAVRHERPLEGEDPNLIILNRYILGNEYNNTLNITTGNRARSLQSLLSLILICLCSIYIYQL